MLNNSIKVMVVDDHPMFRSAIRDILLDAPFVSKVIEAENGADCLEHLGKESFDLILMDINMPGISGLECLIQIVRDKPDQRVAMLSQHNSPKFYQNAMDLGACGYLVKGIDADEFIHCVEKLAHDTELFPTEMLLCHSDDNSLTKREVEIMLKMCNELSTKDIAEQLSISVYTVNLHRVRIQKKIGVKNLSGVVKWAIKNAYLVLQ